MQHLFFFIARMLRPWRYSFFSIFLICFVWSLDATVWPYLVRRLIDVLTRYENQRETAWIALRKLATAGALFWLLVEGGFRLQGWLLARVVPQLEAHVRMTMFEHVQKHSPKYFNEKFAGSLANKISDMTNQITAIVLQVLTLFFPAVAASILSVAFMAFVSPLFSLILAIWFLLHYGVCIFFAFRCARYENIHGQARSRLQGQIVDSLSNNFAVNLFYRFSYERTRVGRYQKKEQRYNRRSKIYVEIMRFWLGQLTFFIGCLAINGSSLYLWLKGSLSTGELTQVFNTNWNIAFIMWMAGSSIPSLFQSLGLAKQALEVMKDKVDILDDPAAGPLHFTKGEIAFEEVSFVYDGRIIFENLNLFISGGEKVGIVGYSGAGKSTLIHLLLRFCHPQSGRITIDGQDIAKVTLQSLRELVTLVPQDPVLFHRTLKENMLYSQLSASDEDLQKASRFSHCDSFIAKKRHGFSTKVGERGTKLSGGERQRIAIVRAMLSRAPILLLDEATSALDSVTETYIQSSLLPIMKQRTCVVIAHRLSTLSKMDRIVVLEKGRIVEEGSFVHLLEMQGVFAKMWRLQSAGFLPSDAN